MFLCAGNPEAGIPESQISNLIRAPCADSFSTLEEQMRSLDKMGFLEGNDSDTPPIDDEVSVE
jgi:hypothetical protein